MDNDPKHINPHSVSDSNSVTWYHGVSDNLSFDDFDVNFLGKNCGYLDATKCGFWFSNKIEVAKIYCKESDNSLFTVKSANITANNIYEIDLQGQVVEYFSFIARDENEMNLMRMMGIEEMDDEIINEIRTDDKIPKFIENWDGVSPIFQVNVSKSNFWTLIEKYDAILLRNSEVCVNDKEQEEYMMNDYMVVKNTDFIANVKNLKIDV